MKTGERLLEFIHSLNMDSAEFAESIGVSSTTIHHIVSEKGRGNDPSKETIGKITNKYPKLNIVWLLSGEGQMIGNPPVFTDKEIAQGWDKKYYALLEKYTALLEEVNKSK